MTATKRATSKHTSELEEAFGHLNYFRYQKIALEAAMRRMAKDLRICAKEIKRLGGKDREAGGQEMSPPGVSNLKMKMVLDAMRDDELIPLPA